MSYRQTFFLIETEFATDQQIAEAFGRAIDDADFRPSHDVMVVTCSADEAQRTGFWSVWVCTPGKGDLLLERRALVDDFPFPLTTVILNQTTGVHLFYRDFPDDVFFLISDAEKLIGDVDRIAVPVAQLNPDGRPRSLELDEHYDNAIAIGFRQFHPRANSSLLSLLDAKTAWVVARPKHRYEGVRQVSAKRLRNYVGVDVEPEDRPGWVGPLTGAAAAKRWISMANNSTPEFARIAIAKALDHDPDGVETLASAGLAFLNVDLQKNAVEVLEKALALSPSHETAWYNRACAKAQLGDDEGALADLARAFQLSPDDREVAQKDKDFERLRASDSPSGKRFWALVGTIPIHVAQTEAISDGAVWSEFVGDGVLLARLYYRNPEAIVKTLRALALPQRIAEETMADFAANLSAEIARQRWDAAVFMAALRPTSTGIEGWVGGSAAVFCLDGAAPVLVSPEQWVTVPGFPKPLVSTGISGTSSQGAWFTAHGEKFGAVVSMPIPHLSTGDGEFDLDEWRDSGDDDLAGVLADSEEEDARIAAVIHRAKDR